MLLHLAISILILLPKLESLNFVDFVYSEYNLPPSKLYFVVDENRTWKQMENEENFKRHVIAVLSKSRNVEVHCLMRSGFGFFKKLKIIDCAHNWMSRTRPTFYANTIRHAPKRYCHLAADAIQWISRNTVVDSNVFIVVPYTNNVTVEECEKMVDLTRKRKGWDEKFPMRLWGVSFDDQVCSSMVEDGSKPADLVIVNGENLAGGAPCSLHKMEQLHRVLHRELAGEEFLGKVHYMESRNFNTFSIGSSYIRNLQVTNLIGSMGVLVFVFSLSLIGVCICLTNNVFIVEDFRIRNVQLDDDVLDNLLAEIPDLAPSPDDVAVQHRIERADSPMVMPHDRANGGHDLEVGMEDDDSPAVSDQTQMSNEEEEISFSESDPLFSKSNTALSCFTYSNTYTQKGNNK